MIDGSREAEVNNRRRNEMMGNLCIGFVKYK